MTTDTTTPLYQTRFGSLSSWEKGGVEPVADRVEHYAFSNCFEIAQNSAPYEKVVFGQNQEYVLEVLRAEGTSPWYLCAHDEFVLSMDGSVEVHLQQVAATQQIQDKDKSGAVLLQGAPGGARVGWMKLQRGHQGMLPANTAYQFRCAGVAVLILQSCKGELSIERWQDICQKTEG